MVTTDETTEIFKRFGDEESTLFDRHERLSFEVQLKQAILGRSLSEPSYKPLPKLVATPIQQGQRLGWRRGWSIQKALKKFLKPNKEAKKDLLESKEKQSSADLSSVVNV
ncbi:uncharacterized protein Fot_34218 [Forsythia ovata]|uniref:Uncharacterized protein n=1 Tax=Forsythia ovata TaxID=205694 RepID=A0ABD1SHV0_9LAMI